MRTDDTHAPKKTLSKAQIIGLSLLKGAFALLFVLAAIAKLAGVASMVAEFDMVGFGQWFRYATAVIELVGAFLICVRGTAFYGAVLLTLVCVGAFIAQVSAIHEDWVHTVVMGALLVFIAFVEWNRGVAATRASGSGEPWSPA